MISTPWGYDVDADKLPPIISATEFSVLTGGVFSSSTERVNAMLDSVSAAIRDYCGWHIAPSLQCGFLGNPDGNLLMLPAMGVSGVEGVMVVSPDGMVGIAVEQYEWNAAGMVRKKCGAFPKGWQSVKCVYTAGFSSASLGAVVAQIAGNALAATPGVSEERVGNAGITYNKTGDGVAGGVSLFARDYELLAPYRLNRAW